MCSSDLVFSPHCSSSQVHEAWRPELWTWFWIGLNGACCADCAKISRLGWSARKTVQANFNVLSPPPVQSLATINQGQGVRAGRQIGKAFYGRQKQRPDGLRRLSGWQVQWRVVDALVYRELRTRVSDVKGGFLGVLVQPLGLIAIWMIFLTAINMHRGGSLNPFL